jgi:hypothetical protein
MRRSGAKLLLLLLCSLFSLFADTVWSRRGSRLRSTTTLAGLLKVAGSSCRHVCLSAPARVSLPCVTALSFRFPLPVATRCCFLDGKELQGCNSMGLTVSCNTAHRSQSMRMLYIFLDPWYVPAVGCMIYLRSFPNKDFGLDCICCYWLLVGYKK